ncbi:MAG: 2-(1,2-epoxy-1,2-dihydrophenyl)acetyl-CoA isomerase [Dehalococcoidia bacterium]|nr:2-(1,2-epoxy-1,2-dihydrophenyl)acetyl-CoA isomerase [Dehalococcoidia bacterium]
MPYKYITVETADQVTVLTLNRPERLNALTEDMIFEEFPSALRETNLNPSSRALIITGAGDGFCSGVDVANIRAAQAQDPLARQDYLLASIQMVVKSLRGMQIPVIAAINGAAAGAGVSLALLCDMRLASEKAKFNMAFVQRGLVPDFACSSTLPRLVGMSRAMELVLGGRTIGAPEALSIGLVDRLVPPGSLLTEARGLALSMARVPPVTARLAKQALYAGLENSLEKQVELEIYCQKICVKTEDYKEAIASFMEKRAPQFKGK